MDVDDEVACREKEAEKLGGNWVEVVENQWAEKEKAARRRLFVEA
jgi:hypothetical protein